MAGNLWPGKRSRDWLWALLLLAGGLWAALIGLRILVLGRTGNWIGFLILAAGIGLTLSLLGYFGLRPVFYAGWMGLAAGLGAMIGFYRRGGGWEDLIGPLVLIEMFAAGIVIGFVWVILGALRRKISRPD